MENGAARSTINSREQLLRALREALPGLRERYGVSRLAVYGSFAHGHPGPRSDVDLLVELERPLGLEFVSLVYSLEEKLGRTVEVATFETLRRSQHHPRYREVAQHIERTLLDVEPSSG